MDELIREQHREERGVILALIPDVFFSVTVRNTIRRIGYDPHILKTTDDLVIAAGETDAVMAVVDIAAVRSASEWADVGDLVGDELPILAFGAHKDVEGLQAAKAAGVTRVVSNGQFHREMPNLIERYALAASCALIPEPLDDDLPLGSLPPGMSDHLAGRHDSPIAVEK